METEKTLEAILGRYSCRAFDVLPLHPGAAESLIRLIERLGDLPFGTKPRFALVAATEQNAAELRGLGTYGFIKNPRAFLLGVPGGAEAGCLEDFGYALEMAVIEATKAGIGSCVLGGSFARSAFARALAARGIEGDIPCVVALGRYPEAGDPRQGLARRLVRGGARKPWGETFATEEGPLVETEDARAKLGPYALALDALRAAPSASNKQPWRLRRAGAAWDLSLARTPGYDRGLLTKLLGVLDLQRVDMGIAMANFALAARAAGIQGSWKPAEAGPPPIRDETPIARWIEGLARRA